MKKNKEEKEKTKKVLIEKKEKTKKVLIEKKENTIKSKLLNNKLLEFTKKYYIGYTARVIIFGILFLTTF